MAHFAELNSNNVVRRVIVISDDNCPDPAPDNESAGQAFIADVLGLAGEWKQTSYNGNFRGNYAGVGYTYDSAIDAFLPPQPFPSWTVDDTTLQWVAPVAHPDDGNPYRWDEENQLWIEVTVSD